MISPLRLNTDGIRYLNILEFLKGNFGTTNHDFLPHGYPWFLYMLNRLHLLGAWSITLVNILSILTASYFLAKLLKVKHRLLYFTLVLLSFINIKQYTLPISDQFFTLVFILSIYFWTLFLNGKKHLIIPAIIFTALSIYIRTAGFSIIIGLIFYSVYLKRDFIGKNKLLLYALVFFAAACITVFMVKIAVLENKADYIKQLRLHDMIGHPASIIERLCIHIKELGEIAINIPYSKLSSIITIRSFDVAQVILIITGLFTLFILYRAVISKQLYKVFLFWACLGYVMIIALWPFYDTRFLLPLVPVIVYLFFYYIFNAVKFPVLKFIPITVYVLLGLISLFYSDAMSVSKPYFLSHYGFDPVLTRQYEIHFKNQQSHTNPVYNINNNNVLYLLENYDNKPFN